MSIRQRLGEERLKGAENLFRLGAPTQVRERSDHHLDGVPVLRDMDGRERLATGHVSHPCATSGLTVSMTFGTCIGTSSSTATT